MSAIVITRRFCPFALLALVPIGAIAATNIPVLADTYVDQSTTKASTNFGSNGVVAVSGTRITLIRFDAAQVAQSTGSAANLKVNVLLVKNTNDGVAAHLVQAPWNERTVTANSFPALSAGVLDQKTVTAADQGKVVSLNVSAALAQWRSNPAANFGIALVPAAPVPNLQLGSREGGSPAVLAISGPAADNEVTVSANGGDYSTIADAANNALEGDKWCVSPQLDKPCTIHVAAGLYTGGFELPEFVDLVGEEKGETRIVGGVFAHSSRLSDLTITAEGPAFTNPERSGVSLERVAVRMNITPPLQQLEAFHGGVGSITDSDITIEGTLGNPNLYLVAFDCLDGRCGSMKIRRSHISVISRDSGAQMFDLSDGFNTNNLDVEDSTFYLYGKQGALFLTSSDEYSTLHRFVRTAIDVTSPGGVGGFSGHFSGIGFVGLQFIDSRLNFVAGGGGIAVDWQSGDVLFDGTTVNTNGYAAVRTENGTTSVLRSQISGGDTGLYLHGVIANIESSYIKGAASVRIGASTYGGPAPRLQAVSSVLSGPVQLEDNTVATCDRVRDQNGKLLQASCTPSP